MVYVGVDHLVCLDSTDPTGIFATANASSSIIFADVFPPSSTNCQFNSYVYTNGNALAAVGFQSNCSDVQLRGLKFSGLYHHFIIVAGIESDCNYDKFPTVTNLSVLVESFINNRNLVSYQLNDFLFVPFASKCICAKK